MSGCPECGSASRHWYCRDCAEWLCCERCHADHDRRAHPWSVDDLEDTPPPP